MEQYYQSFFNQLIFNQRFYGSSQKNSITQGLSGQLGNAIVFRQVGDRTIVSTPPTQNGELSEKQKAQRARFQQTAVYGQAQVQDAATKAMYETGVNDLRNNAYVVAVADFLSAPDIEEIDLSKYTGKVGDSIRVRVTDDFQVKAVSVRIENGDGSLVEAGSAVRQLNPLDWLYTATKANATLAGDKITVLASDIPGNTDTELRTL